MSSSVLVEPAIAFVREKGTARDKALLGVLLGEAPSDEGLEALREGQNPDGGFRVRELPTQASVVGRTMKSTSLPPSDSTIGTSTAALRRAPAGQRRGW